jgi:hypothetical protein
MTEILYIIHCLRIKFHSVSVLTLASIFRLKGKIGDPYLIRHLVAATLIADIPIFLHDTYIILSLALL